MKRQLLLIAFGMVSLGSAAEVPKTISNGFAEFDRKEVAAQLRYEVTIVRAPHTLTQEQLGQMKARLEAQNQDPVVIQELLRSASYTKGETRKKIVEIVAKNGIMKCTVLPPKGEEPKSVEYVNGDLICTALKPMGPWEYSIERPAFFSAPHALAHQFLPWYLGIFSLERLFENKGTVNGETISRTFEWERNRSIHVDAHWSTDSREFDFQETYGQRKNGPTEFAKLSDWKTIGGYSIPGEIVLTTLQQVNKTLHSRMTIKLVSAKFGEDIKTDDLPSLGPVGKEVEDCRFGQDACVRYEIPDHPLTDAEVQALLDKQDQKGRPLSIGENPPPPPPTGPSGLIYLGAGAVLLGSLLLIFLRKR